MARISPFANSCRPACKCSGNWGTSVQAGGKLLRPVRDEFYGDRSATLEDPFGHVWMIQTHVEDVPKAEMRKRLQKLFSA